MYMYLVLDTLEKALIEIDNDYSKFIDKE